MHRVKASVLHISLSVQFLFFLFPLLVFVFEYDFVFISTQATRESDYMDGDLESLQNLLRSSARDCVPKERNSLVDFQSKTGVEVCTFKLVLKNAASLLDDKDPLILEADNILNDLVRSFSSLIVLTNGIDMNLPSDRKKIADAVTEVISFLDKFEKGVKDCLEI